MATDQFEAEYYQQNYPNYARQNPLRKLKHYESAVRQHLPPAARPKVFDLGCAFGAYLGAIDPGWDVYGADVSRFAVAAAKERVPRGHFDVITERSIPFDNTFEAITAWDVIEHIPDLERVAAEVNSHLVERGAFVFVVPVYDGPLGPVVMALDKDPTHIHKTARRFWIDWASRHFELVEWWGIFRYLMPGGYYAHIPTRALRSIAPAILVVARRRLEGLRA